MGLDTLKQAYPNAQVYLHENEKEWLKNPELNASALMLPFPVTCKTNIDEYYVCDTPYNLSGLKFHVRHTPGHSIGGISLVFEEEELIFPVMHFCWCDWKNRSSKWESHTITTLH